MKRLLVIATVIWIAALVSAEQLAHARPRPRNTTSGQVTCTPNTMTSPITSTTPLTICVSGFAPGNFVSILVPWVGTPDLFSTYTFSEYVGASGGFCYVAPPTWATMTLTPGTYAVKTAWSRDGLQTLREGPSGALNIVAP